MIKLYVVAPIMTRITSIRDTERPPCIDIPQPTFPPAFVCLFFSFSSGVYCATIVSGILADAFLISQHRFRQLFEGGWGGGGAVRTEVSSQTLGADSSGWPSSLQLSLSALRLNKQDWMKKHTKKKHMKLHNKKRVDISREES